MINYELIATIFGSSAFGASLTYLLFFKKNKAEGYGAELENVKKAIEIWRTTCEDLTSQVDDFKNEVRELKAVVNQLHLENKELKKQLKIK